MSSLTMARPYARAIFELAFAQQAMPQWSEMLALAADIAKDPTMAQAIKNPRYPAEALTDLFLEIGSQAFTPDMQQFINVLATFKRFSLLPDIQFIYEAMRAHAEKRVNVEITSAMPLEPFYQQQFIEALKKRLHCDIALACKTDHSLLGGAIIRANDLVIDGSVRGRLATLSDAMGLLSV